MGGKSVKSILDRGSYVQIDLVLGRFINLYIQSYEKIEKPSYPKVMNLLRRKVDVKTSSGL